MVLMSHEVQSLYNIGTTTLSNSTFLMTPYFVEIALIVNHCGCQICISGVNF